MGNPLRFYGDDEFFDDDVIIPANCSVEVTFRTLDERYLLRPDERTREILLGCFGRAYAQYPGLNLHALNMLSNHGCFLATPTSPTVLSSFMQRFLSTAGTQLNLRRDRRGKFWARRYRAIPCADETAVENRFQYVLTQGTKENLVWRARDWPGPNSIRALTEGKALVGRWRDRGLEYERKRQRTRKIERAARRGKQRKLPRVEPLWLQYEIPHHPLPHWRDMDEEERTRRIARILRDDDELTRRRHARDGTRPLGTKQVLRTSPFDRPADPKRSPAPLCHASTPRIGRAFRKAYNAFVEQYRDSLAPVRSALAEIDAVLGHTAPPIPVAPRNNADVQQRSSEQVPRPPPAR